MAGLFGHKTTITNTENKIGALRIQSSSQGLPIAIVFGKTRVPANLLWYGDFTAIPHTETTSSGGKGGGGVESSSTTYTYTAGVIFGMFEGPSVVSNFIGTVWKNKDVTTAVALGLAEFTGSYSQTPWSYMTSAHPTEARAYRGTAYCATAALDLGSSDGLPNLTFEVTGLVGSSDVNLADVLSAILTSDKFGAGWPSAQLGSLTDFSNYCAAAGFLASPAYTAQQPASEIVAEICRMGNAAPVWSEGVLKVKTYADETVGSYVPDLTVQYNLGYGDFMVAPGQPPVKITRKRQADAFNQVQLEILDRSNQYNPYIAEAKDQWNIDVYGLRPLEPIQAHAICDANVGRSVAQTILQRALYIRNTYEFTLGWRYARLEPMDIVSLTEPLTGLNLTPVRITEIDEDENGELAITAEDLNVGVSTPGSYAVQPTQGSTPSSGIDPGDTYAPVIFQPPLALSITPQVWIGAQGGAHWGGAQVWVSTDGGGSYAVVGNITNPARYGALTANFPTGADPDTTHVLSVDLTASRGQLVDAPSSSADSLATLCYVDGELVAPSNVTLTSPYHYDLDTYIRRGQGGSSVSSHLTGAPFMRLDAAVAQFDVATSLYGTTLYIKLLSYNTTGGGLQALADVSATTFTLVAQAATGSGFAFMADRTSTAVADPGAGKIRWNNASQASANMLVFDAQTNDGANMVAYFASVGNAGYLDLRDLSDTAKWASYTLTSSNAPAGFQTFGVAFKAGGAEISNGHTVIATFSPTPPTGVTSVGLNLPTTVFTVTNSPVTTTGNLTAVFVTQNAATFLAGPLTGNAAAPSFRAFALTDIPPGANTQVITTSNGAVVWANASAGSGGGAAANMSINTVTGNYTLALTDAGNAVEVNSANVAVLLVPSNANVAFNIGTSILLTQIGTANFTVTPQANVSVLSSLGNASFSQYSELALYKRATNEWVLTGERTGYTAGTVTSVGLSLPSLFSVAGSPITSAGNLTATLVAQNAALVFAGPTTGNAAAPTFRTLGAADFGNQVAGVVLAGPVSGANANAAFRALAGGDIPRLTVNTQTANYTLALADGNVAYVRMSSANATVVTLPSNANVSFANGTCVLINRTGAGAVTVSSQANVTVNNPSSNTLRVQRSTVGVVKVGTDEWDIFGDLT